MDRVSLKKERISGELLPLARKLLAPVPGLPEQAVRARALSGLKDHCKTAWMLSDSVARDYADLALRLAGQHD